MHEGIQLKELLVVIQPDPDPRHVATAFSRSDGDNKASVPSVVDYLDIIELYKRVLALFLKCNHLRI